MKKSELIKQVNLAYDKIVKMEAKYGTTQGEREKNKELFWYGSEAPDSYDNSETGDYDFIVKDISRSELIFARFVKTWRELTRTAFGEEWQGTDITKALKDRIEQRLFEGQVAVFRHPVTNNLVAENFTYDNDHLNIETNLPSKITIVSDNASIDGLELKDANVAIGYNNSSRTSELSHDMPQLEMIVNSYMALAMTIKKSKPKTLIAGMDDDTLAYDIRRAVESDNWIEFLNISAKQLQQIDIRFDNGFKDKMEMIIGSVADFIKFKGFNTNGYILKRERQSESELDNNDEFKHYLVYNKVMERQHLAEQIQEKLGGNITYEATELMEIVKGDSECQEDEVSKNHQTQESAEN